MPADLYEGLTEPQRVIRWRYREARDAGLTKREAAMYAESDIDCERLRELVRNHFPPPRLADTLL